MHEATHDIGKPRVMTTTLFRASSPGDVIRCARFPSRDMLLSEPQKDALARLARASLSPGLREIHRRTLLKVGSANGRQSGEQRNRRRQAIPDRNKRTAHVPPCAP